MDERKCFGGATNRMTSLREAARREKQNRVKLWSDTKINSYFVESVIEPVAFVK